MQPSGNTVLITGGATGIGLHIASRFIAQRNTVILCGRRQQALDAARTLLPQVHTFRCDVAQAEDRQALAAYLQAEHPQLNVLINNAGIQRRINLQAGPEALAQADELTINLEAPIRLTAELLPRLLQRPNAAIVNVGSGLGMVPVGPMPLYCASKAGLHAYTQALRHQLRNTAVRVFELLPPVVNTELDQGARAARGENAAAMEPAAVAEAFWRAWLRNREEIPVGRIRLLLWVNRIAPGFAFRKLNERVRL